MTAVLACAVFLVTYALIATERVHRVTAALGGAAALAVIGVVDTTTAFFDSERGIDWNVIFLLFGMMVIVGILKQTGLFSALAIWCARASGGRPFRLMVLLILVTALASALLDNVTTVLLVAPVTITVARQLGLPVGPYLITVACASNIGGTATLIGDPPNIMIASRAGLTFNDFLVHLTPIVVVLVLAFIGMCWVLFRRQIDVPVQPIVLASPSAAITDRRTLTRCLVVLALVVAGFTLHASLHVEPALVALLGAGAMVVVSRARHEAILGEVEWPTLVFFMGLFVLVGGLTQVGVLDAVGAAAVDATGERYFLAATVLLFGSAVLGAVVDNIPYTAAMLPVVEELVASAADPAEGRALWWAFALGADLGGNTTAVAAGANVVVTGIAAREEEPISFWTFTKYGLVVTSATLLVCWPYLWLRYFA